MSESEDREVFESVYFWLRCIVTVVVVVGPLHRRIVVTISALSLLVKTLSKSAVLDGEFVERPELETELLEAVSSPDSETVLLYGERGGGKTSLVHHAFRKRKGVITVNISKTTHDEAQDEMIEEISSQLHILRRSQPRIFIADVFAMSPIIHPIVVISLEARCGGDALEGVVTTAKILSYDSTHRRHPRIVVDISGSRAAIEAGAQLEKRRVIGVHVGHFLDPEALEFVSDRIPKSFVDPLRRQQIANLILEKFDWHVLTLKKVCRLLERSQPTDKDDAEALIREQFELEKKRALMGWISFCKNLEKELDAHLPFDCRQKVACLLLEGRQESTTIIHSGNRWIEVADKP